MADTPKLIIRRATIADLSDIMIIERNSFPTPWSAWFFRTEITSPRARLYLVATLDGTVIGYAGCRCVSRQCHIGTLAVAQAHRRQGIAQALLLVILGWARKQRCPQVTLEYRIRNYPAARLYEKAGFGHRKVRIGYYTDTGEDAIETSIEDLTSPDWAERLAQQWATGRKRYDYDLEIIT